MCFCSQVVKACEFKELVSQYTLFVPLCLTTADLGVLYNA